MKKQLSFIILVLLSSYSFSQTMAHDFTQKEFEGLEYNLFEELDNNKTVILSFFGTGCVTCQNHVNTLDSIWNENGYNGDSLWLWGIESTRNDSIHLADFITQFNPSYPLFSTELNDSVLSLYDITYTPQYYVVCPDLTMKKVDISLIPIMIQNCKSSIISKVEEINNSAILNYYGTHLRIFSQFETETSSFYIYDISGRLIKKWTQTLQKGDNDIPLSLKSGIYICKSYIQNNFRSLKFHVN